MPANDVTRATRTALPNITRVNSLAAANAAAFGEIDINAESDAQIHLAIPLTTGNDSTLDLYLIESQDGAEWTDNIDPTTDSGNVAAKIKDAKKIARIDGNYDATNRTAARLHFSVLEITGQVFPFRHIGFVLKNNDGQAIGTSGADGDYELVRSAAS